MRYRIYIQMGSVCRTVIQTATSVEEVDRLEEGLREKFPQVNSVFSSPLMEEWTLKNGRVYQLSMADDEFLMGTILRKWSTEGEAEAALDLPPFPVQLFDCLCRRRSDGSMIYCPQCRAENGR